MQIDVKCTAVCKIDIDSSEAFRILCKSLNMDFVLEDKNFIVKKDEDEDENYVYIIKDGKEEIYDERGDLFVALRNVAVNMFPNLEFRNENYIYNR